MHYINYDKEHKLYVKRDKIFLNLCIHIIQYNMKFYGTMTEWIDLSSGDTVNDEKN